jgi:hypothetical protein
MVPEDDRSARDDVLAVVRAVAEHSREIAGSGAGALGGGLEEALGVLVERRVERALRAGSPPVDATELVQALGDAGTSAASPWLGASAARLARTGRAARFVGGRTPVGLAIRFGPALYQAISGNLRGFDAAAGHLVTRARDHRIDPDPERLRTVVVQALAGDRVDPDGEADLAGLVRVWLGDAGRRMVPFGLRRISGLNKGRTPEAVAAALAAVDVRRLRRA